MKRKSKGNVYRAKKVRDKQRHPPLLTTSSGLVGWDLLIANIVRLAVFDECSERGVEWQTCYPVVKEFLRWSTR